MKPTETRNVVAPIERTNEYTVMYRPVGPNELKKLDELNFKEWPPRLPEQPIFYPVTNEGYADQIARVWNVPQSKAGFVTRFCVRNEFADKYTPQKVGGAAHTEWWIPAEELSQLNKNIVGPIEVIRIHGDSSKYSDILARSSPKNSDEDVLSKLLSPFEGFDVKVSWNDRVQQIGLEDTREMEFQLFLARPDGVTTNFLVSIHSADGASIFTAPNLRMVCFHKLPELTAQVGNKVTVYLTKGVPLGEASFI